MDNNKELLPAVNKNGDITGCITRKEAHNGSKILHPVVHLHVFNSNGDIYLQKRPSWKDVQPGKWDTATGGHIDFGEDVEKALLREVEEELGIKDFSYTPIGHYIFESDIEKELIYVHKTVYNEDIFPNPEELECGKFWSENEIKDNIGKNIFTPNFEYEYKQFFMLKEHELAD